MQGSNLTQDGDRVEVVLTTHDGDRVKVVPNTIIDERCIITRYESESSARAPCGHGRLVLCRACALLISN